MALIDVSFLLSDPMFVDPCTVLREIEDVDDDGMAVRRVQRISIQASIQANSGDELVLLPDGARASGTYEVITTFPLAVATDTTAADIVIWRRSEFVVTNVSRYGNFGAGHYEGVMTIKTISPPVGPP